MSFIFIFILSNSFLRRKKTRLSSCYTCKLFSLEISLQNLATGFHRNLFLFFFSIIFSGWISSAFSRALCRSVCRNSVISLFLFLPWSQFLFFASFSIDKLLQFHHFAIYCPIRRTFMSSFSNVMCFLSNCFHSRMYKNN